MTSRRTRRPAAALLIALVLAAGCSPATEPGPPPVAAGPAVSATAQSGTAAVDIALRSAAEPLPDVVGDPVGRARRRLHGSGVRTQVVAFDADAVVTAQQPRGGESPPADGVVTVWVGGPPAVPPPPPPPPPAPPPVAPASEEAPAAIEGSDPVDVSPVPLPAPATDEAEMRPTQAHEPEEPPQEVPRAPGGAPSPSRPGTVLEGPATWYGPGFAGNRTACGGRFDPDELTMASRELACGTRARVTGASGRSVDVTVTDWGPAEWTGKRFDLSAAAFAEIANLSAGVVRVTVEVLD